MFSFKAFLKPIEKYLKPQIKSCQINVKRFLYKNDENLLCTIIHWPNNCCFYCNPKIG